MQDSGEVLLWGSNDHGQLGVGDTNDRFVPVQVDFDDKVIYLACHHDKSAVILGSFSSASAIDIFCSIRTNICMGKKRPRFSGNCGAENCL